MHLFSWIAVALTLGVPTTTLQEAPATQAAEAPPDSTPAAAATPPATGFLYETTDFEGETYAFCVYVPPEYTPEQAWPVVLFLHGSGGAGDDGFLQADKGIAEAIRRKRELCPAIVVMPQARRGHWWDEKMLLMALRCVEQTSRKYRCDPSRLYLTGLSMGGAGTWLLGSQMPDVFAALVPICGFLVHPQFPPGEAELEGAAARLARVPIWCFHGAADKNVPAERSRELVKAVTAAGGSIKYTEMPDRGHDIWSQVYRNPAVWRWMLSQSREQPRPETP